MLILHPFTKGCTHYVIKIFGEEGGGLRIFPDFHYVWLRKFWTGNFKLKFGRGQARGVLKLYVHDFNRTKKCWIQECFLNVSWIEEGVMKSEAPKSFSFQGIPKGFWVDFNEFSYLFFIIWGVWWAKPPQKQNRKFRAFVKNFPVIFTGKAGSLILIFWW